MQTFKQYLISEMGGATHNDYVSRRTGGFNPKRANKELQPLLFNADRLLRRRDRLNPDAMKIKAQHILTQFVDKYDKLGDEATELKAKIADKYTQVKQLLQSQEQPVEDCVNMLQGLADILRG